MVPIDIEKKGGSTRSDDARDFCSSCLTVRGKEIGQVSMTDIHARIGNREMLGRASDDRDLCQCELCDPRQCALSRRAMRFDGDDLSCFVRETWQMEPGSCPDVEHDLVFPGCNRRHRGFDNSFWISREIFQFIA